MFHTLGHLSTPLAILLITPLIDYFAATQINTSGSAAGIPFYVIEVAQGVALIWLVWVTLSWLAEAIIASPRVISPKSLDANLIRLAARTVGIVAIVILLFRVGQAIR